MQARSILGPRGLSVGQITEIKQTIESWSKSLVKGDFDAWRDHWDESAVLIPPGERRVVGRQNIENFVKSNFGGVSPLSFEDWEVVGREDLAVAAHVVKWSSPSDAGQPIPHTANQMIVMRLSVDGRWRIQAVILSMVQPTDQEASRVPRCSD